MRTLYRNAEPVYYRRYLGDTQAIDAFGNKSGEMVIQYGDTQECLLTVAPNKSQEILMFFGNLDDYDKAACTSDRSVELDENSAVWLGLGYVYAYSNMAIYPVGALCIYNGIIYRCIEAAEAETFDILKWLPVPYNAICKKRAPWKNSVAFALKDVDVT